MIRPSIVSIQVGLPRDLGVSADAADPHDRPWHSAFMKEAVAGPVRVGRLTIAGDGQADLKVHGGPDRPILAYSAEHYPRWEQELGVTGVPHGAFGENFTITGLDEQHVCIGDRYAIGTVRAEVSQPRQPCWKLARRWRNKSLPERVIHHRRGGWYLRVLHEGTVSAGESLELIDRPFPQWTVARAFGLMYDGQDDIDASANLAACPALSADWKDYFEARVANARG